MVLALELELELWLCPFFLGPQHEPPLVTTGVGLETLAIGLGWQQEDIPFAVVLEISGFGVTIGFSTTCSNPLCITPLLYPFE